MGWASVSGPFMAAGVTFEDPNAEVYSATPADPPPEITAVGVDFATIIGASRQRIEEGMWQLGQSAWNHAVTSPWLQVKSPNVTGWLPPSATSIVWQVAETQRCNPFANLHGLVRGASLARAKRALAEWAPKPGTVLQPLAIAETRQQASDSCTVGAAIFPSVSEPPALVQYDCGGYAMFTYSAAGARAHFMIDDDRADIVGYEFTDLFGDANPELLLEVGLAWSHDYTTVLLILPSEPSGKALGLFPLSGLEAQTEASWSVNTTARQVNVSRTSGRQIEAIRLVDRAAAHLAPATAESASESEEPSSPQYPLVEQPGFLALFSRHSTLPAAELQALDDAGAMVLPLSGASPVSFATGNVFASQLEACTALAAHRTTPAIRALAANRPCQRVSHKK